MRAVGKIFVQLSFDPLGTGTEKLNLVAAAFRAVGRHLVGKSAHMAEHAAVAAVIGQNDGTVLAQHALAAMPANHEARKAAAIQQQHRLLLRAQALRDLVQQAARESGLPFRLEKLHAHVDNFHLRHGALGDAFGQAQHLVFALLRVVARLDGWAWRSREWPQRSRCARGPARRRGRDSAAFPAACSCRRVLRQ